MIKYYLDEVNNMFYKELWYENKLVKMFGSSVECETIEMNCVLIKNECYVRTNRYKNGLVELEYLK